MTMVSVTGLVKRFGQQEVLKGVDLRVERGEVVSVIGPSGSGKSTFLRCLNLLERPNAGRIDINGVSVDAATCGRSETHTIRAQSAMVFQSYNLFRNKTALQNVTEALVLVKKKTRREAEQIGLQLLDRVGLADHRDKHPVKLSGGQQQRVSIARALAVSPRLLLFDEPTSALDPELVGEVLAVIRQLANEDMTMILVTHEMEFAHDVSDSVVFMDHGVVVEQGPPGEVLDRPQHERTRRFLRKVGPGRG